ncbi:ABC transporter ATP-binding protein [Mucilaginibacter dorajii]|uniref:ABC transporter domain-containing protein n=1 Tax=Mucilaginibacter dorajii TaxID=692994 RepID=A0ABP7R1H8_9SPHI|nr:ATP-binding cassette domain-containing protein [Mucilaginibacter dorajii]MCS3732202.1 ABC-2 type transport system ATP-binding protein [Mucilaginibacter dorajii]
MLQFHKFQKFYGRYLALKIGDVLIEPGVYWVKGVNGSGKSTLLKTIAGILWFDGDILIDGKYSVKKTPVAYRKLVNFADAEPLFPEFLTGKEMVDLFLYAKGALAGQEKYFIESMQMQSFIDQPIGAYSSGMLKKLSLILAFIGNPKLILLDEPLITLDTDSLGILYQWILFMKQQNGTSFILSSHQDLDSSKLSGAKEILVETQILKITS